MRQSYLSALRCAVTPTLPRSKPYYCHDSLIFQFVLAEFLIAFSLVQELEKSLASGHIEQETLRKTLALLGGESIFFLTSSPSWNLNEGALAKLNNHCFHLVQSIQEENPLLFALHRHADNAFLHCIHGLNALRPVPFFTEESSSSFAIKMVQDMHRLAVALPSAILHYKCNENVLFFFLRYYLQFDTLYHPGFSAALLANCSDGGLFSIEEFLLKAYRKRGFSHLLPIIQLLFIELSLSQPTDQN